MKKSDYLKAVLQFIVVMFAMSFGILATVPASFIVAATARKQTSHPQGKPLAEDHLDKYKRRGSSGRWEYWNSNLSWLRWFNNYEDGLLREPSGKGSARAKGKERSYFNMLLWIWRNPFNWGKRTIDMFHCMVNECDVYYRGKKGLTDRQDTGGGWAFTKAVHRQSGKSYYSFRWIKHYRGNKVRQFSIGFKIKPDHQGVIQDRDDADKAFTFRLPVLQSTR